MALIWKFILLGALSALVGSLVTYTIVVPDQRLDCPPAIVAPSAADPGQGGGHTFRKGVPLKNSPAKEF
ncbi:hypothetical protein ACMHYO_22675 [Allopusillimonas ginsengisoli]|uniref:hypothetical protein n=1 Tax=Allopusillimonas ginsengisoli TaxID=453575 RepID=UPI0039C37484